MKDKLTSEEIEKILDNILNDHDISASDLIQILQQYINDLDPLGEFQ